MYDMDAAEPRSGTTPVSFSINGRLTNLQHTIVGQDSTVAIGKFAHSALQEKGAYVRIGAPGEVVFSVLDLQPRSQFK